MSLGKLWHRHDKRATSDDGVEEQFPVCLSQVKSTAQLQAHLCEILQAEFQGYSPKSDPPTSLSKQVLK